MKFPRMTVTLFVAIFLGLMIVAIKPSLFPVTLYKLSLLTLAGVVGYYLDRELFPYARPDAFIVRIEPGADAEDISLDGDIKLAPWKVVDGDGFVFAMAMLRRAIIVGCAMLAIGLGS